MTNVLIIPTSGILEFNASATAGGAPATLDNFYANAVRLEIASSATLKVTGKNAVENKRFVVNGTNGDVLTVRDASSTTEGATASLTTPVLSATVISATTYYGIPGVDTNQFVAVTGDTMTGPLILDGSAQGHLMLSSDGSIYASGYVSATSGIFTNVSSSDVSAATLKAGTSVSAASISSAGDVRAVSAIISNTVQAPTLSGGTLTVTGNASVTGTVSSTGNMLTAGDVSSTGAHRGSSGIFTATVQAPTLSGTSAIVSSLSALSSISATGNILTVGDMSSTGAHRGSSGIFTTTVQAPTLSGTSGLITNVSSTDVSAATLKAGTSVSAASISSAGDIRGVSAIISNTVQAPTLSGGTLTVTGNASVTGTVSSTGNQLSLGEMSSAGAHRGSSGIFTTTVQAPTLSGTSATVSSISALSSVSAPSAFVQNISATNVSAATNVSSAAFSGVSARFTDLSATSALALTISAANISATGNVSSAAFSGVSARFTDLSATSSLAQNVSAASGRFPALSATVIGTSAIVPGAAAGVASTDLVISAGAGQISVSGNAGLALSSGGAISLNATAVNVTNGTLSVTGHFAATSKAFVIDHPTPAKKAAGLKLQYACLEGPENGVYVRGKADTQVGVIELPDYWMDLVHADSITVQLTAMSPAQRLYVAKIEDNKVYVRDASAVSEVTTFFYTVNGERKDIDHLTIEY
jgi:hypothetical protein